MQPQKYQRYTLVIYHFSIKQKVDIEVQKKEAERVGTTWKKYRNHYYSYQLQLANISLPINRDGTAGNTNGFLWRHSVRLASERF